MLEDHETMSVKPWARHRCSGSSHWADDNGSELLKLHNRCTSIRQEPQEDRLGGRKARLSASPAELHRKGSPSGAGADSIYRALLYPVPAVPRDIGPERISKSDPQPVDLCVLLLLAFRRQWPVGSEMRAGRQRGSLHWIVASSSR